MFAKAIAGFLCATAVLCSVFAAQATTIDMVTVGNAGNTNDGTGFGGVDYPYLIGKYEITNAQWREFLTAKARVSDPYGLYNTDMAGTQGGIAKTWSVDHYVYTPKNGDTNWDNRPVNFVSFWDAARFTNWLHNGQGNGDTESGAYTNIDNQSTFARLPGAKYVIPTEDEWYKAAYHKNDGVTGNYFDYPTTNDGEPSNALLNPDGGNNANFYQNGYTIGSPYYTTTVGDFEKSASPYGTFDQGGNLWEWNQTKIANSARGLRGGAWYLESEDMAAYYRFSFNPTQELYSIGFRVASVPEPGSTLLLSIGVLGLLAYAWRRRK